MTACHLQLEADRSALRKYTDSTGIKNVHFPSSWKFLEKVTKRKRIGKTREILSRVLRTVSPDGAAQLSDQLLKSYAEGFWMEGSETPQVSALLGTIAEAYRASEKRQQRLQLLSLVAPMFPLTVLQQYIPGLTEYMFTQSRVYAALSGPGIHTEPMRQIRVKCTQKHLWAALDFIASDLVSIPAPFGTKKMKLSTGEIQEVDLYIRQQSNEHIYQLYKRYMEESQQTNDLLSRSLFLQILNKCPALK